MATKRAFSSQDQVKRIWGFLDVLSRRAWEREEVPQDQKKAVNEAAGRFYAALLSATRDLPPQDLGISTEPPSGVNVDNQNWEQFARNEFVDMVGRRDITSITEAYLKATYLLQELGAQHQAYVFRGHHDISWDLVPRRGRQLQVSGWIPPSNHLTAQRTTTVLSEELSALEEFQDRWPELKDVDELDKSKKLPRNNAEWWFRMQHYDRGDGTRLLDVTTSIPAALLFACVDWETGEFDDNQDGVIYLWSVGRNANTHDFLLRPLPDNAENLFTGYPDAPVFILNPPHNERSKAQSGAFYWWPKFWEPPPYGAPYYLRVPRRFKESIVTDLLRMGFGPKDAVRGIKGLQNEQRLRKQLDFPSWNPLDLT